MPTIAYTQKIEQVHLGLSSKFLLLVRPTWFFKHEMEIIVQTNKISQNHEQEFEQLVRDQLEEANQLLANGNLNAAVDAVGKVNQQRDDILYCEVGKLTRSLHESINSFAANSNNSDSSITGASDRLTYVVKLTEQAANETLDKVDEGISIINNMESEANAIKDLMQQRSNNGMNEGISDEVAYRISSFLDLALHAGEGTKASFSHIMCAQEYQDLSAQALEHASKIVTQLEADLINLMKMASNVDSITGIQHNIQTPEENYELGQGPKINAEEQGAVSNQDDVDDLLTSLGF